MSGCEKPDYTWNEVNQILINEKAEVVVVGTNTGISTTTEIKSPYISSFDSELYPISKKEYPTITTALNPKLVKLFDESHILSFYRAESLDLQTEHSHLLYLDKDLEFKNEKRFGHRTRIESLIPDGKDFISYQYEREKLNSSISIFRDSAAITNKKFAVSDKTNIPTDLLIKDSSIYISGIADGFHYRDGHEYKNPNAYDYIFQLNKDLKEQNLFVAKTNQHSFANSLSIMNDHLLSTGSIQKETTGMDAKIQCFDENLNEKWSFVHRQESMQKGIKSIPQDGIIYVLCETYNKNTKRVNILLLEVDQEGIFINDIELQRDESYHPKDFVITDKYIFIAATKQSFRTTQMQSVILQLDKVGNFYKERIIE